MQRGQMILWASGVISLITNLLTLFSTMIQFRDLLQEWSPDRGLVLVLAFITMAYSLTVWAAANWRWTRHHQQAHPTTIRAARALLNGLAAFPLLTLWLHQLFSLVLYTQVDPSQRWLLALIQALMIAPFVALGLIGIGGSLGPLLGDDDPPG